jgi:WD40 repeat protein
MSQHWLRRLPPLPALAAPATAIAFALRVDRLAACDESGRVTVWGVPGNNVTGGFKFPHGKPVSLAFVDEGATLAVGGERGIVLWDSRSGKFRDVANWQRLLEEKKVKSARSICPAQAEFLVVGETDLLLAFDAAGNETRRLAARINAPALACAVRPDGRRIAVGTSRGIGFWSGEPSPKAAAKQFTSRELKGHAGEVQLLTFSGDMRWLASAGRDHTIGLWNADTGRPIQFAKRSEALAAISFSSDGRWLIAVTKSGTVALYRLPDMDAALFEELLAAGHVSAAAISTNDQLIALATDDGEVTLAKLDLGLVPPSKLVRQVPLAQTELTYANTRGAVVQRRFDGHPMAVTPWTRQEKPKAIGWVDGAESLLVAAGTEVLAFAPGRPEIVVKRFPAPPFDVAFPGSGDRVAWCRKTVRDPELVVSSLDGNDETNLGLGYDPSWSPDGRSLLYYSFEASGTTIAVWDGRTTKKVPILTHDSATVFPAISPDDKLLVFGSMATDGTHQLVLSDEKGENIRQLTTARELSRQPSFSPDGSYIAFLRGADPAALVVYAVDTGKETIVATDALHVRPVWRVIAPRKKR